MQIVGTLRYDVTRARARSSRLAATRDPAQRALIAAEMAQSVADIRRSRAIYEPLVSSPEEAAIYARFGDAFGAYQRLMETVLAAPPGEDAAITLLNGPSNDAFARVIEALGAATAINMEGASQSGREGPRPMSRRSGPPPGPSSSPPSSSWPTWSG